MGDVDQLDGRVFRQRMVFVDGHADVFAEAQLLAQVVVAQVVVIEFRFAPETHVDLLGAQGFVLHRGTEFMDGPADAGKFGLEFFQQAGDGAPHGRADDAHAQAAHFAAVDLADGVDGHAHLGQQVGRLVHQRLARHGQLERARGARKQAHAQFAFQFHDLLAQRRLRDMQALGGAAEAFLLGNGKKIL